MYNHLAPARRALALTCIAWASFWLPVLCLNTVRHATHTPVLSPPVGLANPPPPSRRVGRETSYLSATGTAPAPACVSPQHSEPQPPKGDRQSPESGWTDNPATATISLTPADVSEITWKASLSQVVMVLRLLFWKLALLETNAPRDSRQDVSRLGTVGKRRYRRLW